MNKNMSSFLKVQTPDITFYKIFFDATSLGNISIIIRHF